MRVNLVFCMTIIFMLGLINRELYSASPLGEVGSKLTKAQVKAALPALDTIVQEAMLKTGVPGVSVAVVFEDEVVYLKGFGVREMGKLDPVSEDTVFQIASMSKPVAGTIVATLASQGVVSWDSRISELDPSFQLHDEYPTRELTIRDLFSHRSGLGGDVGDDLERIGYDRNTILKRLHLVKPASSFRSTYAYNNFGLTQGAVAAAKATGQTWEDVSDHNLYKPLGMSSTSSRHADFLKRPNRAALHIRVGKKWVPAVTRQPDAQSPSGGVSSNSKDLAQWLRLVLAKGKHNNKEIISEAAIKEMLDPVINIGQNPITGSSLFYGMGWSIDYGLDGKVQNHHSGAFSQGARSLVNIIPSEKLGIVVLANAFPSGLPEGIADTFFDVVHHGKPSRDWLSKWNSYYERTYGPESFAAIISKYDKQPDSPIPALAASAYIGTFANDYIGDVHVIEKNSGLALQLGPKKQTFPLKHYDQNVFLYNPIQANPDLVSPVTFFIGEDKKAKLVIIDALNSNNQGELKRKNN